MKTFDKRGKICDNIYITQGILTGKYFQKDGACKMTILKKITALLLAASISIGGAVTAFADESSTAAGTETSILTEAKPETSLADTQTKPETSIIPPDKPETAVTDGENEDAKPESGVDLSDINYTPIDLTGYERWNGKTKLQAGTNYYISGKMTISKSFTVPVGSKLVVTPGSDIGISKSVIAQIKGSMVIEPKSTVTYSCTFSVAKGAGFENYGTLKATLSSVTRISGEYIIRHGSTAAYSGTVNIYKDGMYLNYGGTTLTKSARMLVTGDFQNPVGGRLTLRGYLAVTISGRASFAGSLYLYGELINSGVMTLEKNIRYYKTKGSRFAISKSSRLIDYRYYRPSYSDEEATDTGRKGIDVSYAQGAIDWGKVKMAGIEFAILRASRGYISEAKPMMQDVTFEYNVTEATAYGIDVGVYHYLYASTVEEARQEAKFFLETIKPYKITYPVVLDVEEQYQADLGKDKITEICKAFLDEIKAAGYYPMIYANKAWLTNYLDMSKLSEYDVWLAQWNTVPTYKGEFGMWQYSSKGIVSGIDGYVDLNLSYKNYASIIEKGGYNHLKDETV